MSSASSASIDFSIAKSPRSEAAAKSRKRRVWVCAVLRLGCIGLIVAGIVGLKLVSPA